MRGTGELLDRQTQENMEAARSYQGRPASQVLVPYRNVGHLLDMRAQESPDNTFLIYYDANSNRTALTYAEFNARVNQTANLLAKVLGVKPGDRVATLSYNHSSIAVIYFACWKLGACVVPQNVTEDASTTAYVLRHSGSVVALVCGEYLERAERIIRGWDSSVPNIRHIVQLDGEEQPNYLYFPSAIATQAATFRPTNPPTLETEGLLAYTDAATGTPKGVTLTQYNMLVNARAISDWQGITGNQRMMCVLPIDHVNGTIVTLVTPLYVGGSTVLNRLYQSSTFWQRIAQEKVHIASVVPMLLQSSCEYADSRQAAGQSIWGEGVTRDQLQHFRHVICGVGMLAVALARRFEDRFGFPILHGYGLSETTSYSCFLPIDLDLKAHQHWMQDFGYPSIGCPMSGSEMAIFHVTGNGQMLGPGERGEIYIRGHNVMKQYYQRADANRETFKFGWLRSGDEGFYEVDERGRQFFFITGRIKELINRGGLKFSPFDIEEVLLEIPGIKIGLAIAFENAFYGEEVGAYVVLEEGSRLTEDAILTHCRQRLPFEQTPKVIVFGTEIPVTATGRYQRLRLRDLFVEWTGTQFRRP
jgi:long-chain acyl-CoA synthetase